jgi:chemotaxis response regulator CheB
VTDDRPHQNLIRAALCVHTQEAEQRLTKMLEELGHFDITGITHTAEELTSLCHAVFPDLIVIDEDVAPYNVEAVLGEARAGRPVPCVVLGIPKPERPKKRRANVRASSTNLLWLDRQALVGSNEGPRTQLQTRLLMLAAELTSAKRTQTNRSLQDAIRMVRVRARHTDARPEVVTLGTTPLNLVLLAGDRSSVQPIAKILSQVGSLRVPVVLALRDLNADDRVALEAAARVPLTWLSESARIRRTSGLIAATGDLTVTPELLAVKADQTVDIARVVSSMSSLAEAGLTILLSDEATDGAYALDAVRDARGFSAVLDPDACPSRTAADAALKAETAGLVVSLDEIAWLVIHAVPRRV